MSNLELEGVDAGYGGSQVLFGVSLAVGAGEVVSLMGRNGMGKSTTLRSVMGLVKPKAGRILFDGRDVTRWPSHRIAKAGVGYVPEGRQVFPDLSVRENLIATAANTSGTLDPWTVERVFTLFPRLAERRDQMGRTLSGGEQQMLAIGRALMINPAVMILDEATEGLAPLVREEIWRVLEHNLRAAGQAILVVDQHPEAMARIADRHYLMERGRIVWTGDSAALRADAEARARYLGV